MITKHILLAESDDGLAHIMALLLKQAEFQVSIVKDSREALQLLTTLKENGEPVDLVITDLYRLTLEADQRFLNDLATQGSAVPVIAITNTNDDALIRRLSDLGCAACITKPFEAETLMNSIHAVLQ